MIIRLLHKNEMDTALDLISNVFSIYEAPEFSKEGIEEFELFLGYRQEINKLSFYGAWEKDKLLGVIAMRRQHISLFFVADGYHHQGIGRKLFEFAIHSLPNGYITVNSSPYAVEIYKRMGFQPLSFEKITNGVRYTPMRYNKQSYREVLNFSQTKS